MDDPDEYMMERELRRKDPARVADLLESIDRDLHYGIPSLKLVGWVIALLLGLMLWRLW